MATNVPMIHKQIFFREDVKSSILLHKAKQQQQQHFVALANSLSSNTAAADAGSIQAILELLCDLRCTVVHICVSLAFFLCFSSRVPPAPISYTSSFTIAECVFLPPIKNELIARSLSQTQALPPILRRNVTTVC
jgi:hypothetical protein